MANNAVLNPAPTAVKTKVSTIMGPASLNASPIKTMVSDHLYNAMSTVIDDIDSVLGNTRMVPYVASSMTAQQKTDLGLMKIPSELRDAYTRAGSAVMHNGTSENLWFHNGNVYKISAKDDFEDAVALVHTRIAYLYINTNGDSAEATTALGNYNTELSNLS
ncbi:MAG: hypothetical protein Unbinned5179contig1000_33 [Prokaryotic dsDNA virus sp.]|nr:MAG: hypothetical protein Unbinned5179contig1000_33 [Prokaryotic dsDNA virus sp.]|tara:strand:- start:2123 stop:2608 length:486 start_codon:yes stop_codon:yes gene_type:complete